jgi:hypothetical protein
MEIFKRFGGFFFLFFFLGLGLSVSAIVVRREIIAQVDFGPVKCLISKTINGSEV